MTTNEHRLTDDEREDLGQRLMLTMTCNHGSDYFGSGAVCETCFANTQRIGRIIEHIVAAREDKARAEGAAQVQASVEALAGDWERERCPGTDDAGWNQGYDIRRETDADQLRELADMSGALDRERARVWDEGWQAQEDYADGVPLANVNPYRTDEAGGQ